MKSDRGGPGACSGASPAHQRTPTHGVYGDLTRPPQTALGARPYFPIQKAEKISRKVVRGELPVMLPSAFCASRKLSAKNSQRRSSPAPPEGEPRSGLERAQCRSRARNSDSPLEAQPAPREGSRCAAHQARRRFSRRRPRRPAPRPAARKPGARIGLVENV